MPPRANKQKRVTLPPEVPIAGVIQDIVHGARRGVESVRRRVHEATAPPGVVVVKQPSAPHEVYEMLERHTGPFEVTPQALRALVETMYTRIQSTFARDVLPLIHQSEATRNTAAVIARCEQWSAAVANTEQARLSVLQLICPKEYPTVYLMFNSLMQYLMQGVQQWLHKMQA
jgi:hypothetical protein